MDYEKAYKHALDLAKQVHDTTISKQQKENIEIIFPELRKSEDEEIRKILIELVKATSEFYGNEWKIGDYSEERVIAWLQKQGENHIEKNLEMAKTTWSEEDKKMLDEIIDFFENGTVKLQHDLSLYASRLKSLKQRHTWKPSKEQMTALSEASSIVGMFTPRGTNLQSLYNDLKKL